MSEGTVWGGQYSATRYPIVYRVVTWVRIASIVVALFIAGGFSAMAFQPLLAAPNVPLSPVLVCIDVCLTSLMLYLVWWAFTAQIVLREDAIEQSKPFFRRVLRVSDIKGRRYTTKGNCPMIFPRSGGAFSIDSSSYGLDSRFDEWFTKLPDLKQIDAKEDMERIRNDPTLGATPSERIAEDARRRKAFTTASGCLTVVSMIVFFAGMMFPGLSMSAVIVAAVVPWCAVLLGRVYKDQWFRANNNNAAVAVLPMMMPIFTLVLLALNSSGLLDSSGVIVWGGFVGLPLWLAGMGLFAKPSASTQQALVAALIFVPFAWLYGGSLLALGNRMLDQQPPQLFQTEVLGKHLVRGKGGPSHYLELAGWGPETQGTNLRVDSERYFEAKRGDVVCMGLHPGKFGFPWMHSIACSGTPSAAH